MTPQRIRMIDARPETLEKVRYRPVTLVRKYPKIQRNDPCPCGSGKKYKKCCGAVKEAVNDDRND